MNPPMHAMSVLGREQHEIGKRKILNREHELGLEHILLDPGNFANRQQNSKVLASIKSPELVRGPFCPEVHVQGPRFSELGFKIYLKALDASGVIHFSTISRIVRNHGVYNIEYAAQGVPTFPSDLEEYGLVADLHKVYNILYCGSRKPVGAIELDGYGRHMNSILRKETQLGLENIFLSPFELSELKQIKGGIFYINDFNFVTGPYCEERDFTGQSLSDGPRLAEFEFRKYLKELGANGVIHYRLIHRIGGNMSIIANQYAGSGVPVFSDVPQQKIVEFRIKRGQLNEN